ncbi:MAG: helix-turn-helix transcriptional regulator [Acidobacteria bacterium]|nr:helix-turn-helix transcriptional regulator [Acidobacteriota bacterium]
MKSLARHMEELGTTLEQLVVASGLDAKVVHAITTGNYTPSPLQRQRIAAAIDVSVDDIEWGHTVPVEHMWGHGPQFGRTP